jgi:hypothetical protein
MGYQERERQEQLNLFNPALFSIQAVAKILRPQFPNHFGEAEHDSFIDDLMGLPNDTYDTVIPFPVKDQLPPEDTAA